MKKIIFKMMLLFVFCLPFHHSNGADVEFSGVYVGLVEVRTNAWGNWLVITLKDAAGNQITRLCDAAVPAGRAAIPDTTTPIGQ